MGTATNWATVAAGNYHSVAVKADGTLWAWGRNFYGQVGDAGPRIDRFSPVQVGAGTDWDTVTASGDSTVALRGP